MKLTTSVKDVHSQIGQRNSRIEGAPPTTVVVHEFVLQGVEGETAIQVGIQTSNEDFASKFQMLKEVEISIRPMGKSAIALHVVDEPTD